MAIESLAHQASLFMGSLIAQPQDVAEVSDENGRAAKKPEQRAVIVTISEAARALIAPEKSGNSAQSQQEAEDQRRDYLIEQLKKRIIELEEELKDLELTDLPKEEKEQEIQGRETQLMDLRNQLVEAEAAKLKAAGFTEGGGTRASGFGNSSSSF
jgi:hypothetical protein